MVNSPQLEELDSHAREAVEFIVNKTMDRVNQETNWYSNLGADEAHYLHEIVLTAVTDYITYARNYQQNPDESDQSISADHLFNLAPLETTNQISLDNVIETTRIAVDTIEDNISQFVGKKDEAAYVRSAMYYSREVAFSAAQIYGRVAVTRSIWDTRDEAFIIESLLNQDYSPSLQSRVANFKWQPNEEFFALVGIFEDGSNLRAGFVQADLRSAVLSLGGQACISSHDDYTIVLIGMGPQSSRGPYLEAMAELFDTIPLVCFGPKCPRLEGASETLRAAVNGFKARFAYPEHPNPMRAEDLLAERALFGDEDAQNELYNKVYLPMKNDERKTQILSTLQNYLFSGSSLEKTAQVLKVHPNTIRYRLKKSVQMTGWDATDPREAYVLLTAIKIGLYKDSQIRS
ncbi:PucR family transcriptional regulator [Alloscardovia venturai]|uniref:PucR family transcriptional regulator n=1 Tax=Alloscardovia venturai TaxID=1769421 RepID=A0ABW2Y7G4_9BIFI